MLFSEEGGEMVKVSPTWKPQAQNAMRRLERVLEGNLLMRGRWEKESGYLYRVGQGPDRLFLRCTGSQHRRCDGLHPAGSG